MGLGDGLGKGELCIANYLDFYLNSKFTSKMAQTFVPALMHQYIFNKAFSNSRPYMYNGTM